MGRPVVVGRREADALAGDTFAAWFMRDSHWSRAGLPLAIVLFLLGPIVRRGIGRGVFPVYLQLPVYMLHQYEEHAHGAFKRDVNRLLAGRARLTDRTIFWINILGVWGVDLCTLYLARYVRPAFGLAAPYLAIVNGLIHVGGALRARRYNPGLWTSLLLLLPVGGVAAALITRACRASRPDHLRGLGAAVALHVIVILSIVRGDREPVSRASRFMRA